MLCKPGGRARRGTSKLNLRVQHATLAAVVSSTFPGTCHATAIVSQQTDNVRFVPGTGPARRTEVKAAAAPRPDLAPVRVRMDKATPDRPAWWR